MLQRLLVANLLLFAVIAAPFAAQAADAERRVLVLYSYHPNFSTTGDYQIELNGAFEASIDIHEEFLDSKRHSPEIMFEHARRLLGDKFQARGAPTLVLTFDDNALIFAERYRDELFPEASIVFAGVNSRARATEMGLRPYITGVHENVSIEQTIELAMTLHPTPLKRVIGIIDDTATGRANAESFLDAKERFRGLELETLSMADYTLGEFLQAIASETRQDTVFLQLGAFRDKTGRAFDGRDLARWQAEAASRPVYTLFPHYVVGDVVGGEVLSFRQQAREAIGMAHRILAGESPSTVRVLLESPNETMLNEAAMRGRELRLDAIPEQAHMINAMPTFREIYGQAIIAGAGVLTAMLMVLCLVLTINRRARERLQSINGALAAKNDELIETKARIQHNALHDALTSLPNRRYLDQILAEKAVEPDARYAMLQVDLDRFKQINDTLGHAAGDAVLVAVAERLRATVSEQEFVARIGGDEFIVVCDGQTDRDALKLLADQIIGSLCAPVIFNDQLCRFGASVGIVIADETGCAPNKLLIDVDFALYKAKSQGRNRAEFFSAELQRHIFKTRELAEDIQRGLSAGEFLPFFQPQIDTGTLEIAGVEALARWRHPSRGLLTPDVFLEAADGMNLVAQIDATIFDEARAAYKRWRTQGIDLPRFSVNVSPQRLRQSDLPQVLADLDIPRGALSFELLESTFLDSADEEMQWNLDRIREAGVDIEIDDFGSGHASVVSLIRLRPDRLKLDRFLTSQLTCSSEGATIIRSILEIANALNIDVIAEGVEDLDQLRMLREFGCRYVQGYYFAKPMCDAEFAAWILDLPRLAGEVRAALTTGDVPILGATGL